MDKDDYRNTTYCQKLEKINEKKLALKIKIRQDGHPRTENFYEIIRDHYKRDYLNIYNQKCSYCGVSVLTTGYHLFEIDHYKNKASYPTVAAAGEIDNLVLSCYTCNRGKSKLEIVDKYLDKLQPDNSGIRGFFYRDKDYSIKISDEYSKDTDIIKFYKSLKLDYEFRRIDFLLLNMDGLYHKLKEGKLKTKIGELKGILKEKRALIYTTRE
ncbi:MAG: HNH endonuclease signature motif containing protein [Cetobacterium sp.]